MIVLCAAHILEDGDVSLKLPKEQVDTFIDLVFEIATPIVYLLGVIAIEVLLRPPLSGVHSFFIDSTLFFFDMTLLIMAARRFWRLIDLFYSEVQDSHIVKGIVERTKLPEHMDSTPLETEGIDGVLQQADLQGGVSGHHKDWMIEEAVDEEEWEAK